MDFDHVCESCGGEHDQEDTGSRVCYYCRHGLPRVESMYVDYDSLETMVCLECGKETNEYGMSNNNPNTVCYECEENAENEYQDDF